MQDIDICVSIVNTIVSDLKRRKNAIEKYISEIYLRKHENYRLASVTSTSIAIWRDDYFIATIKYDYEDFYPYIVSIAERHYYGAVDQCVEFIMSNLVGPSDNKRRKLENGSDLTSLENDLFYLLENLKQLHSVNTALTTIKRITE